jgi:branched-chain amino acid transport system substrate-binding protein
MPTSLKGNGKVFYEAYKKAYNSEPEGYAVYGYESAKVVLSAIQRAAAKDRAGIISAIKDTKDFPGALGNWSFDENGDTSVKMMSGNTVQNGEFVLLKVLGQ